MYWPILANSMEKFTNTYGNIIFGISFSLTLRVWINDTNITWGTLRPHRNDETGGNYPSKQLDFRLKTYYMGDATIYWMGIIWVTIGMGLDYIGLAAYYMQ